MLQRRRTKRWQLSPTRVVFTDVRHAPGYWREGVRDVHFFVAPSTFGVLHLFVFHTLLDGLAPIAERLVVLVGLLVVVELGFTFWALDNEITGIIEQACEIAEEDHVVPMPTSNNLQYRMEKSVWPVTSNAQQYETPMSQPLFSVGLCFRYN